MGHSGDNEYMMTIQHLKPVLPLNFWLCEVIDSCVVETVQISVTCTPMHAISCSKSAVPTPAGRVRNASSQHRTKSGGTETQCHIKAILKSAKPVFRTLNLFVGGGCLFVCF